MTLHWIASPAKDWDASIELVEEWLTPKHLNDLKSFIPVAFGTWHYLSHVQWKLTAAINDLKDRNFINEESGYFDGLCYALWETGHSNLVYNNFRLKWSKDKSTMPENVPPFTIDPPPESELSEYVKSLTLLPTAIKTVHCILGSEYEDIHDQCTLLTQLAEKHGRGIVEALASL